MRNSIPLRLPNGRSAFWAALEAAQADFDAAYDDGRNDEGARQRYMTTLSRAVIELAREYGLAPTLRSLHAFYTRHGDKFLFVPVALEPFLEGTKSYWAQLEATVRERWPHVWNTLLAENDIGDQIFTIWSPLNHGNLEQGIENLFIDAVRARLAVTEPAELLGAEDLAITPIPLSRSVSFVLRSSEANSIIEKRRGEILALLRR